MWLRQLDLDLLPGVDLVDEGRMRAEQTFAREVVAAEVAAHDVREEVEPVALAVVDGLQAGTRVEAVVDHPANEEDGLDERDRVRDPALAHFGHALPRVGRRPSTRVPDVGLERVVVVADDATNGGVGGEVPSGGVAHGASEEVSIEYSTPA